MLLFYVYIAAFVLGGILLGASMLLGHHDGHADGEADAHASSDSDAGADAHADGDAAAEHGVELSDFWLPFVSVRFWVFFLCFFGLTGTVFTLLALAGKWLTLGAAVGTGVVTGFAAAFVIQRLKRHEVGVAVSEEDFKGLEGTVILPLAPGTKGKIRLEVRGQTVDLVVVSDAPTPLERGSKVVVIDFRDSLAVVVPAGELEAAPRPQELPSATETENKGG
jgi:membrane protein implicated in regulation of membrane protease activity